MHGGVQDRSREKDNEIRGPGEGDAWRATSRSGPLHRRGPWGVRSG